MKKDSAQNDNKHFHDTENRPKCDILLTTKFEKSLGKNKGTKNHNMIKYRRRVQECVRFSEMSRKCQQVADKTSGCKASTCYALNTLGKLRIKSRLKVMPE